MFDYRTATAQQVFDYVVIALTKQRTRSVNEAGMCLYRSPDGRKCAAGHLISDDDYYPGMEGSRWIEAIQHANDCAAACKRRTFSMKHSSLILSLQILHDNCKLDDDLHFDKVDFNSRCRQIAAKFGLDVTVLDNSDDRH